MGIQNLSQFLKEFLANDYDRVFTTGCQPNQDNSVDTILIDGTGLLYYIAEKSKSAIKKTASGDFGLNRAYFSKYGYYPINDKSKEHIIANVMCKYINQYILQYNPKNIFIAFDGKCARSKRCLQRTRIAEREQKEQKNPIEQLEWYNPEFTPIQLKKLSGKNPFGLNVQNELKSRIFRGVNVTVSTFDDPVYPTGEGDNKMRWYMRDHPYESHLLMSTDNDMVVHLLSEYNNMLTCPNVILKRDFSFKTRDIINIITLRNVCLERFGTILQRCKQLSYIKDPAVVIAYMNYDNVSSSSVIETEQRCIRDLIGIMCLIQSDYIPKLHHDAIIVSYYFKAYLLCKSMNTSWYLLYDNCTYNFGFVHELYKIILATCGDSGAPNSFITDLDPKTVLPQNHYYIQYMLGQSLTMQNFIKGDLPHYTWEYFGSRAPTIREFVYFFEIARYNMRDINTMIDQSFSFDFIIENQKIKKLSYITF
jgi:hypothetical protein